MEDNTQSIIDYNKVTASETRETVINSENFGVDIWGQATVNVNDATTMNTKSAAFLIKSADSTVNLGADVTVNAATDANAQAEKNLTEQRTVLFTRSSITKTPQLKVFPSQKDMLVLYSAMLSILRQKAG